MGHAKVDTALNVYTHVIDGAKRVAAQQVGGELFETVNDAEGTRTLTMSGGGRRVCEPQIPRVAWATSGLATFGIALVAESPSHTPRQTVALMKT